MVSEWLAEALESGLIKEDSSDTYRVVQPLVGSVLRVTMAVTGRTDLTTKEAYQLWRDPIDQQSLFDDEFYEWKSGEDSHLDPIHEGPGSKIRALRTQKPLESYLARKRTARKLRLQAKEQRSINKVLRTEIRPVSSVKFGEGIYTKIDKDMCIACGACEIALPELFGIDADGLAEVTYQGDCNKGNTPIPANFDEDLEEAVEMCPTDCILVQNAPF